MILLGVALIFGLAFGLRSAKRKSGARDDDPQSSRRDRVGAEVSQLLREIEPALRNGTLSDAERDLRRVLALRPDDVQALHHLARVLRIEGRIWESDQYLLELLRLVGADATELVLLGGMDLAVDLPGEFLRPGTAASMDPGVMLWQAHVINVDQERDRAEAALRGVVACAPHLVEAHARIGMLLADGKGPAALIAWNRSLPAQAELHPTIWLVRGRWCEERGDLRRAARCYWEALCRNTDDRVACYRLSQVLIALGDSSRAAPFLERARTLQALESQLFILDKHPQDLPRIRKTVDLCESLGRAWEACAWCRVALEQRPSLGWAKEALARLLPQVEGTRGRVLAAMDPARKIDLSDFPPFVPPSEGESPAIARVREAPRGEVRFVDLAAAGGMAFQYKNGGDPTAGALHMYEFTGGGVAILDFDRDGWPDSHWTQGGAWPVDRQAKGTQDDGSLVNESATDADVDRMFRNLGNGIFVDVTIPAGVGDRGFGQGATVGDFDNDGFPDLYIANIGPNRFYRNLGDGTFLDVTAETGTAGDEWSISCVLADLNGDALPDLYVVNYLMDDDLFTRVCRDESKGGRPGICPPNIFTGQPDRVYRNLGDGRFEEVSASAGIADDTRPGIGPGGKGLGIVAADFSGEGRLDLFVANDITPNFFYVNQAPSRGGALLFEERAQLTGLACDEDGKVQACMGVAAGDSDGDGLLDLYVTNFQNESNTLYRQQPGGFFIDDTRRSNLRESSMAMLGFGTQFLDADLDGRLDLVVANGHIDDYRVSGAQYQMRPQFYTNVGGGRFQELPGDSVGPYFERPCLGRGMARLDVNRDGREDFAVSHLDYPAALLANETERAGNALTLRLSGVTSARDAIGTTVRVTADKLTIVRQLTAGDGYQASNERSLVFGIGTAARVDSLTVHWPSGIEQTFTDLPAGQELLLIESSPSPVSLPK